MQTVDKIYIQNVIRHTLSFCKDFDVKVWVTYCPSKTSLTISQGPSLDSGVLWLNRTKRKYKQIRKSNGTPTKGIPFSFEFVCQAKGAWPSSTTYIGIPRRSLGPEHSDISYIRESLQRRDVDRYITIVWRSTSQLQGSPEDSRGHPVSRSSIWSQ